MVIARSSDTRIELLRIIGALSVFSYHFMGDAETVTQRSLAAFALGVVVAARLTVPSFIVLAPER